MVTRALTLKPWHAESVRSLDKNVENRNTIPPRSILYVHHGLAIHAGVWKTIHNPDFRAISDIYATDRAKGFEQRLLDLMSRDRVDVATDEEWRQGIHRWEYRARIPVSAIVAVVTIAGWIEAVNDKTYYENQNGRMWPAYDFPWWMPDHIGWHMVDKVVLPEPVPCKGKQGIWFLPPDVAEEVNHQVSMVKGDET